MLLGSIVMKLDQTEGNVHILNQTLHRINIFAKAVKQSHVAILKMCWMPP